MTSAKEHVLVVDDDPAAVSLVRDYLERHGASVTTATDPEEGLRHVERENFACVISDYDMPGMDGIEFLDTVRNQQKGLSLVLYTSVGDESVARKARERDAVYVEKSGTGNPLATLVEQVPA